MLLTAVVIAAPAAISAQGLSAEVSAGRLVYDPLVANIGTNNLMGSLEVRHGARGMGLWCGSGAAHRFGDVLGRRRSRWSLRKFARTGAPRWVSKSPGTAIPFATRSATRSALVVSLKPSPSSGLSAGLGFVEGRGGWRGHTLTLSGVRENRRVFETGARAGYGAMLRIEGDARWVHATEGTYPFTGVSMTYTRRARAGLGTRGQVVAR